MNHTSERERRNHEARVRAKAKRAGYAIKKSRRVLSIDNYGLYMLIDPYNNTIINGVRFDMSLEAIEAWLDE